MILIDLFDINKCNEFCIVIMNLHENIEKDEEIALQINESIRFSSTIKIFIHEFRQLHNNQTDMQKIIILPNWSNDALECF